LVYDVDETTYLSKSQANQQHLLKAIKNVNKGANLVEINLEELEWIGGLSLKLLHLKILINGQDSIKNTPKNCHSN